MKAFAATLLVSAVTADVLLSVPELDIKDVRIRDLDSVEGRNYDVTKCPDNSLCRERGYGTEPWKPATWHLKINGHHFLIGEQKSLTDLQKAQPGKDWFTPIDNGPFAWIFIPPGWEANPAPNGGIFFYNKKKQTLQRTSPAMS